MAWPGSDRVHVPHSVTRTAKIMVVGPFGVGKTALVGAVSEIEPLRTEERMTRAGAAVDQLAGIHDKTTTTVALDFGRLILDDDIALYLFGTPGQQRFAGFLAELCHGALGALVLVDSRRLDASFSAMNLVEERRLAHAVIHNVFPDSPTVAHHELREALDLTPDTPVIACDVRDRTAVVGALIALLRHLRTRIQEPA